MKLQLYLRPSAALWSTCLFRACGSPLVSVRLLAAASQPSCPRCC